MSLIKQFRIAIYKFHDYPLLIMQKGSKTIIYFIVFTIITSILSAIPVIKLYNDIGGISSMIENYIPDFEINNGVFSCEKIDINIDGMLIYINTDEDFNIEDKTKQAAMYIVADKNSYIINNGVVDERGSFTEFDNMSKDVLLQISQNYVFKAALFFCFLLTLIISYLISGLFGLIILTFIGNILNMLFTKAQVRLGTMYKLAVYARTFPVLLSTILALIGIDLPFIISAGLVITYMYFGLKNIKSGSGIILAEID